MMNGKVFCKRGLLLLMALLLVVLAMTAAPAFAIVPGITPPGGVTPPIMTHAAGVTLNPSTLTLTVDAITNTSPPPPLTFPTATLTATVTPSTAINKAVTWSSSNINVAAVSSGGVVTAVGPGATTITVTTVDGGHTAACAVTVQALQVISAATDATGKTVIVAFSVPMASPPPAPAGFFVGVTVHNVNDTVTGVTLDSSNSDEYDLTLSTPVQYKQLVSLAYLPGALQTASGTLIPAFGKAVTNTVTVAVPVTGVALNTKTLNLTVGGPTVTLTATVIPSTATTPAVTWISDTPGVATVNNGVVTAVAAGNANIIVTTAGGQTSTCAVTVTAVPAVAPTTTGAPTVTGISPSSGSTAGGTTVTISGSGFTGATAVTFGSAAATGVSVDSDTSITAISPAGSAGAVDVTVVTPGGTGATSSNGQFTYTTITPTTGQTVLQFYIGSTDYNVNSQAQSMDVAPVISDGRTLLPITYVATPLGATVGWNQAQQMVTVTLGGKTIQLVIGQGGATVNGATVPIDSTNQDVTPVIVPPGRTMLPLRFIAENLGCQVDWNGSAQEVTVTYPQP